MRKGLTWLAAAAMAIAACGGDGAGDTTTTAPPTTTTTTTTTVAATTTTTSTTTTTLPVEQQDALLGAALWSGLSDAWSEGPEAAARYIADHTYPGWPAAYEDCLRPDRPAGWMTYVPYPGTVEADEGWGSSEVDVEVEGRIYLMDVEITVGAGTGDEDGTVGRPHFTVVGGEAFFFIVCEPPLAEDALAYRLAEGAAYVHEVSYRAEITEDQRPAGGGVATGRETWTQYRALTVVEASEAGEARVLATVDRVVWEMFADGIHFNPFDTDEDERKFWYGIQGDLAGSNFFWDVEPEGPTIDSDSFHSFLTLPAVPVAAGDTWPGRWSLVDPALSGDLAITVVTVGPEEVMVSFEGTGSGRRVSARPIDAGYVLVTEGTISGSAVIDPATGWMVGMVAEVEAGGTIELTSDGFWTGIRPLHGSRSLEVGVAMPVTYSIRIETATVEG